jgi:hypothetical protein
MENFCWLNTTTNKLKNQQQFNTCEFYSDQTIRDRRLLCWVWLHHCWKIFFKTILRRKKCFFLFFWVKALDFVQHIQAWLKKAQEWTFLALKDIQKSFCEIFSPREVMLRKMKDDLFWESRKKEEITKQFTLDFSTCGTKRHKSADCRESHQINLNDLATMNPFLAF